MQKTTFRIAALASALSALGFSAANAASTTAPTGVNAGFFDLQTDLSSILNGDGGAAIIIGGVLIGAGVLAFTGRWTYVVGVMATAIVLGYGFPVISSLAGVTADIEMVEAIELTPAPPPQI